MRRRSSVTTVWVHGRVSEHEPVDAMSTSTTALVDPSNTGQLGNWDGDAGAFWAAHTDRFDEGVAAYRSQFLAAAAIEEVTTVLDVGCGSGRPPETALVEANSAADQLACCSSRRRSVRHGASSRKPELSPVHTPSHVSGYHRGAHLCAVDTERRVSPRRWATVALSHPRRISE
jgi:hypothetical protein